MTSLHVRNEFVYNAIVMQDVSPHCPDGAPRRRGSARAVALAVTPAVVSTPAPAIPAAMVPMALAVALATSSLYWVQSFAAQAAVGFGPSVPLAMAPGATLLGYAGGVAGLAAFSRDLSNPRGLALHGAGLALALCLAAAAPDGAWLALACLAVGAGCALTQRVLVGATTLVPPERQAQAIGMIICSGLLGIVFARASVAEAAAAVGWRCLVLADAAAALCACLAVARRHPPRPAFRMAPRTALPSPLALLRDVPALRSAALTQAMAVAAFNMGWSLFPNASHAHPTARAAIATAGAAAALWSGRACRRRAPRAVAALGLSAVTAAVALAAVLVCTRMRASGPLAYVAMVLLELGTQVALVANQAGAQAAAPTVPVRGRIAAIMTTIAFGGGAAGAAIGNLMLRL